MAGSVVILVVGVVLGAVAAWRLYTGRSYISTPPMKITRKSDPFSYWLGEAPLIVIALVMIVGGAVGLFQ